MYNFKYILLNNLLNNLYVNQQKEIEKRVSIIPAYSKSNGIDFIIIRSIVSGFVYRIEQYLGSQSL